MIREFIQTWASKDPGAPAILAPGRDVLSYGELHAALDRLIAAIIALGFESNDRIALVCSNGPEMAMAFLAIAEYATCAPLNPGYRASEFDFYLSDLQPRALIVEAGLDSPARAAARNRGIAVLELGRDLELTGAPPLASAVRQGRENIALLLHTSGTTSRPKLIQLTRANLCVSARNIAGSLQLREADRCLNVMPLFHVHGLIGALLATIASGGSVICTSGFAAPKFFEWVEEFQPTWYTAVPTIHQAVLGRASGMPHTLRFIRSCSAALAPSLMEEMERAFGVPVIEAYGMTEAAHQMASNPLPPGQRKPGSVGVAAGPEIAIMDGEVAVRGENVCTDGWFRTGDQGYLDEDGYLFLTGRSKEMINRGGEKIAPREIDEVLLLHPAVAQAVAFAVPHGRLGEAVAAAVVARSGCTMTARELQEFAATRLADFKIPEKILFVDEIPKGPTGKIQRIGLAAKLGISEIREAPAAGAKFVAPRTKAEVEVAAIFASTLGKQGIGLDDNFFDLGGDSLLVTSLLARIRTATAVEIPLLAFLQDPSVRGVSERLAPPMQSNRLRLTVHAGQLPALFCVPGSHGNLVGFFRLARELEHNQPVTAFQLPKVAADGAGYSVEELAARYVEEILASQPEGPYHLVGSCTGGMVAYEMARQLHAKDKPVGVLALMDCYHHGRRSHREKLSYRLRLFRKRLDYHRTRLRELGLAASASYLRLRMIAFRQGLAERAQELAYASFLRLGVPLPAWLRDPRLAIRRAAAQYDPPAWSGGLELFSVEEPRAEGYDYPEMGWQGKAQQIRVHRLPGSHMAMLSEPAVQVLANQLRASLLGATTCGVAEPLALGNGTG